MTPEQWAEVERAVSHAYGSADLVIDGYEITLRVERLKALRHTIIVYVDGSWKGEWLRTDCEQRRRFFRPVRTGYLKPKDYASWRRAFGKKSADERLEQSKGCYWLPDWPSFARLRRHLIKNNTSIALKEPS